MSRRLPVATALALAAGPFFGCAGTVSSSGGTDDADTTATSAIVIIERTIDANEGSRAAASARFVRVASPSSAQDALQAIGAALALPPPGACASVASLSIGVTSGDPAPVIELADVGAVTLDVGGAQTQLLPRQLPDVTDVVRGVVYARAADPSLFPAGVPYTVHVRGGPEVDPFDVTALAPPAPADVRLSGDDGHGTAVLAPDAPFEFTWSPDAAGDEVYVDVRPATGSAVRCALADDGASTDAADHPAHAILFADSSGDQGTLGGGTIVVHRVHRESLSVKGIDSGEIRFDFARSVAYHR